MARKRSFDKDEDGVKVIGSIESVERAKKKIKKAKKDSGADVAHVPDVGHEEFASLTNDESESTTKSKKEKKKSHASVESVKENDAASSSQKNAGESTEPGVDRQPEHRKKKITKAHHAVGSVNEEDSPKSTEADVDAQPKIKKKNVADVVNGDDCEAIANFITGTAEAVDDSQRERKRKKPKHVEEDVDTNAVAMGVEDSRSERKRKKSKSKVDEIANPEQVTVSQPDESTQNGKKSHSKQRPDEGLDKSNKNESKKSQNGASEAEKQYAYERINLSDVYKSKKRLEEAEQEKSKKRKAKAKAKAKAKQRSATGHFEPELVEEGVTEALAGRQGTYERELRAMGATIITPKTKIWIKRYNIPDGESDNEKEYVPEDRRPWSFKDLDALDQTVLQYLKEMDIPGSDLSLLVNRRLKLTSLPEDSPYGTTNPYRDQQFNGFLNFVVDNCGVERPRPTLTKYIRLRYGTINQEEDQDRNTKFERTGKVAWTKEDDKELLALAEKHNQKWGVIEALMGRSYCRKRWVRLKDGIKEKNKDRWNSEEDQKLLKIINKIRLEDFEQSRNQGEIGEKDDLDILIAASEQSGEAEKNASLGKPWGDIKWMKEFNRFLRPKWDSITSEMKSRSKPSLQSRWRRLSLDFVPGKSGRVGDRDGFIRKDQRELVESIIKMYPNISEESQIVWHDIALKVTKKWDTTSLLNTWLSIRTEFGGDLSKNASLQDTLKYCLERLSDPTLPECPDPRRKLRRVDRNAKPVIIDENSARLDDAVEEDEERWQFAV
ncbi:hypothetical protein BJ742DRAFT_783522 [Cladochytrium replicatum]|nr:hypothetical protein BJ742DRAFT_783522 [Cladochytrium replicatum]